MEIQAARGLIASRSAPSLAAAGHQIVIGLQAKEEAGRQAEIAGQAQVGVRGDRPLAEHDFVDPARRNAHGDGRARFG